MGSTSINNDNNVEMKSTNFKVTIGAKKEGNYVDVYNNGRIVGWYHLGMGVFMNEDTYLASHYSTINELAKLEVSKLIK